MCGRQNFWSSLWGGGEEFLGIPTKGGKIFPGVPREDLWRRQDFLGFAKGGGLFWVCKGEPEKNYNHLFQMGGPPLSVDNDSSLMLFNSHPLIKWTISWKSGFQSASSCLCLKLDKEWLLTQLIIQETFAPFMSHLSRVLWSWILELMGRGLGIIQYICLNCLSHYYNHTLIRYHALKRFCVTVVPLYWQKPNPTDRPPMGVKALVINMI